MDVALVNATAGILIALASSGGMWGYMQARSKRKDALTRLMMGLAYDRITFQGMIFIGRGRISKDEYEDFRKYLYEPYTELGGNGVAKRIMGDIEKLPFSQHPVYQELIEEAEMKNER